jgi:hypothetical protein
MSITLPSPRPCALALATLCALAGALALTGASALASPTIDGRGWELVSPPNKHGSSIEGFITEGGSDVQAAEDGSGITYAATGPVVSEGEPEPEGNRAAEDIQTLSVHGADGWSTRDLTTPSEEVPILEVGNQSEYRLFSNDLSLGFLEPKSNTPLPPLSEGAQETIYIRNTLSESFVPLVTAENVVAGAKFGEEGILANPKEVSFSDATPDLQNVVFRSAEALTPNATSFTGRGSYNLYEWSATKPTDQQIQLVSVLPESEGGGSTSGELGYEGQILRNAISNDGERIVWSEYNGQKGLYLRDMGRDETVRIASDAGGFGLEPIFQTASSDGSRVFFTDAAQLTANSHATTEAPDLYVFEAPLGQPLSAGRLTDLTVSTVAGHETERANVQNAVLGVSEVKAGAGEAGYVYFVANGVLSPAAEKGDCEPGGYHEDAPTCNLYVEHYDEAAQAWEPPTFVAKLSNADGSSWDVGWPGRLQELTSQVSPNGQFVAFMSQRELTGYDNADAISGEPDQEVYLYNATEPVSASNPACASCDPSGAPPHGVFDGKKMYPHLLVDHTHDEDWPNKWLSGSLGGWESLGEGRSSVYQPRYLSNEGQLFFNSTDNLVPADRNGVEDVYEFEPDGAGPAGAACTPASGSTSEVFSSAANGCVGLISSGTSSLESVFLDSSLGAGNAFFLTAGKLAPEDVDSAYDVYAAHECGVGWSCPTTPAPYPTACTSAESCRTASPPVALGAPASATFSGSGNVAPVPAPVAAVKPKALTRAQQLTAALKLCRRKVKARRKSCEVMARKRYGAKTKSKSARSDRRGK